MKSPHPFDASTPIFRDITNANAGYFLLRLALGINLLGHGLVRIGNPAAFAGTLVQLFSTTWLPSSLVRLFALVLPFVETILGVLLTLGLLTRAALFTGGLVMVSLIFGTALRGDWETLGLQMIYAALYSVLMAAARFNALSVDAWWVQTRSNPTRAPVRSPATNP